MMEESKGKKEEKDKEEEKYRSAGWGGGKKAHAWLKQRRNEDSEMEKLRAIVYTKYGLEKPADVGKRAQEVLEKLRTTIKAWVYKCALKRQESAGVGLKAGGAVYHSGSYPLGVPGRWQDIDALCVVPRFVDREEDFFGDLMQELLHDDNVADIHAIQEARVPLIKLKLLHVDVDLLFASVNRETVHEGELDLDDDRVLQGCDEKSIYSLNAYRNNALIPKLVPSPETFRDVLMCVKLWAHQRDLYSNKAGYLGGISWAILVAKACQLFPTLQSTQLLAKFYKLFARWDWKAPVLLSDLPEPPALALAMHNWNPKASEADGQHVMPIITPTFPCVNSAFNVSTTTQQVLRQEWQRAGRIVDKILRQRDGYTWCSLFKEYEIFSKYLHFLRIDVLSSLSNEHIKWQSFVESKLRLLILELEQSKEQIRKLRLSTRTFCSTHPEYTCGTTYIVGFKLVNTATSAASKVIIDLQQPVDKFTEIVYGMYGTSSTSVKLLITHLTRDQLPRDFLQANNVFLAQNKRAATNPQPLQRVDAKKSRRS